MLIKRYIIAIGASAGGLPALCEFFDHTLPDGVTYIITTHLSPFYKSKLTQILQRHSDIEVCTIEQKMSIRTNIIYVMPENNTLSIANGRLILTPRDLANKSNMAIDIFFRSLAEDLLFSKIAIILSGMGTDGTKGVKILSDNGAYIIVQSSSSAESIGMPESIVDSGLADMVLDPKDMPKAIIEYIKN